MIRGHFYALSPEDRARSVRMALLGMQPTEIARRLGVRATSVRSSLLCLGVKVRKPLELEREITEAIVRRTGHRSSLAAHFVHSLAKRTMA